MDKTCLRRGNVLLFWQALHLLVGLPGSITLVQPFLLHKLGAPTVAAPSTAEATGASFWRDLHNIYKTKRICKMSGRRRDEKRYPTWY